MPFVAAAIAAVSLGSSSIDWITAQGSTNCSATDVDFSDALHGIASCAFSNVMTTNDGGLNWVVSPTGLQQSLVYAHAVSPTELYVARKGLFRSTNGGATWSELGNLSSNPGSIFDAHIDGSRLVVLQGGTLRHSQDGGTNWQVGFSAAPDVDPDELHFPTSQVGYASGGRTTELGSIGNVLRTEDGGITWTPLSFPFGEITAADFSTATDGAVVTLSSNVYVTADGGLSWQWRSALPDAAYLTDLVIRTDRHWYGASLSGCVYETFNAGSSWIANYCDPLLRPLAAISLRGGAAVAVGNDGLVAYENLVFRADFE